MRINEIHVRPAFAKHPVPYQEFLLIRQEIADRTLDKVVVADGHRRILIAETLAASFQYRKVETLDLALLHGLEIMPVAIPECGKILHLALSHVFLFGRRIEIGAAEYRAVVEVEIMVAGNAHTINGMPAQALDSLLLPKHLVCLGSLGSLGVHAILLIEGGGSGKAVRIPENQFWHGLARESSSASNTLPSSA